MEVLERRLVCRTRTKRDIYLIEIIYRRLLLFLRLHNQFAAPHTRPPPRFACRRQLVTAASDHTLGHSSALRQGMMSAAPFLMMQSKHRGTNLRTLSPY